MQAATAQPIQTQNIQPAIDMAPGAQNPTQIRYGWSPYGDINLIGPDGTPNLYVQDHRTMDTNGVITDNPYHRVIPKGQLIPFPTFQAYEMQNDPDRTDGLGRPLQIQGTRTITALDAVVTVLRGYSKEGFSILNSLQGLDQDVAARIFQVVQPFNYPIGQAVIELANADERIDSVAPMTWEDYPDYVVYPLQTDMERFIARSLAAEMLEGAERAHTVASEILSNTEMSMATRLSGGQGKTGADPLDRRLSAELGRELPKLGSAASQNNAAIDTLTQKVDYLVGSAKDAEIARLREELAAAKGGQPIAEPVAGAWDNMPITVDTGQASGDPSVTTLPPTIFCGVPKKSNGEPCQFPVKNEGDHCMAHQNAVTE